MLCVPLLHGDALHARGERARIHNGLHVYDGRARIRSGLHVCDGHVRIRNDLHVRDDGHGGGHALHVRDDVRDGGDVLPVRDGEHTLRHGGDVYALHGHACIHSVPPALLHIFFLLMLLVP